MLIGVVIVGQSVKTYATIQEVFHVYLNKFENTVTHLFLVILGNNLFPWVNLIFRNKQWSRKYFFTFIFWFETVSEVLLENKAFQLDILLFGSDLNITF